MCSNDMTLYESDCLNARQIDNLSGFAVWPGRNCSVQLSGKKT